MKRSQCSLLLLILAASSLRAQAEEYILQPIPSWVGDSGYYLHTPAIYLPGKLIGSTMYEGNWIKEVPTPALKGKNRHRAYVMRLVTGDVFELRPTKAHLVGAPQFASSALLDMNNAGTFAVGYSIANPYDYYSERVPVVWDLRSLCDEPHIGSSAESLFGGGRPIQIAPFPANYEDGYAYGVNDSGTVVGYFVDIEQQGRPTIAFSWTQQDGLEILQPLAGGDRTTALDINNKGDIVGSSGPYVREHPCMWPAKRHLPVNMEPGSPNSHSPVEVINETGQMMGFKEYQLTGRYWDTSTPNGLTTPVEIPLQFWASAMTDSTDGTIATVKAVGTGPSYHGSIWDGGTNQVTRLDQLIPSDAFSPLWEEIYWVSTGNITQEGILTGNVSLRYYDFTLNDTVYIFQTYVVMPKGFFEPLPIPVITLTEFMTSLLKGQRPNVAAPWVLSDRNYDGEVDGNDIQTLIEQILSDPYFAERCLGGIITSP